MKATDDANVRFLGLTAKTACPLTATICHLEDASRRMQPSSGKGHFRATMRANVALGARTPLKSGTYCYAAALACTVSAANIGAPSR